MLPADQSKPRLVWVKRGTKIENETICENPLTTVTKAKSTSLVRPLLRLTDQDPEAFALNTDHDLAGKFQLPYKLQAASRNLNTEKSSNQCIEKLVGVMPASFWKGPVILTRFFNLGGFSDEEDGKLGGPPPADMMGSLIIMGESQEVEDMTLADLSHAMGLLEAAPMAQLEADDHEAGGF
jgi:hypothetical protein